MAQDEISKKVELNWLSAFYGGLLTDKQRQVLTLHCELVQQHGAVGVGKASAWVDGKCAVTAELTFVLTDAAE